LRQVLQRDKVGCGIWREAVRHQHFVVILRGKAQAPRNGSQRSRFLGARSTINQRGIIEAAPIRDFGH